MAGIDLRSDTLYSGHGDNPALARAFQWLTRNGIGVRFGGRPVGWYQQHQVCAIDAIEAAAKQAGGDLSRVQVKRGVVYAGRQRPGSAREFFDRADRCARK